MAWHKTNVHTALALQLLQLLLQELIFALEGGNVEVDDLVLLIVLRCEQIWEQTVPGTGVTSQVGKSG